jgi:hypothetical protein
MAASAGTVLCIILTYFMVPFQVCLGISFSEFIGFSVSLPNLLHTILTTLLLMMIFYLGQFFLYLI